MEQEIISKKREIIELCLKNGILISSDSLKKIEDGRQISGIFEILKAKNQGAAADIDSEIEKYIENLARGNEAKPTENIQTEVHAKEKIRIIYSNKDEPKKREPQDFVDYFNARYRAIEKILKPRQELRNLVSINKLLNKKQKEEISIIGIVNSKQATKNGNIMLVLEDLTGIKKVIVNKNKPALFREANDIVLDEVIGVVGVNVESVIFANNILWPDVPTNRELKKSDEEKYAIFLSDMHVGSSKFLPEDFDKFLKWINGEMGNEQQRAISKNVEYIFIAGDLVDGCGIYPEQDKELITKDVYQQYRECAKLLEQIPKHIPLIICPGNHDALRISEPQPQLSKDYAKPLHDMNNVVMVSNPSIVNIGSTANFSGFDVMMYHGYSFDYYVAHVDSLRNHGGYDRVDLIMKFLMKRRHLAPTHSSTLYVPDNKKDPLVIERIPDFFLSGHIHKSSTANYRNTTLICGSCWQAKTSFQEKVGHNPEPSRVPIVNLKTRDVKILKFGQ
ncbi:DNA-directed DNA polymerase II small subunit [Candidatus Woesearchaeota archaeon]|nr:DNA-directed DNA polymerase II small subunit [Candidatus Woesearchaeota archaeon]